jgi:hypothetical protein
LKWKKDFEGACALEKELKFEKFGENAAKKWFRFEIVIKTVETDKLDS